MYTEVHMIWGQVSVTLVLALSWSMEWNSTVSGLLSARKIFTSLATHKINIRCHRSEKLLKQICFSDLLLRYRMNTYSRQQQSQKAHDEKRVLISRAFRWSTFSTASTSEAQVGSGSTCFNHSDSISCNLLRAPFSSAFILSRMFFGIPRRIPIVLHSWARGRRSLKASLNLGFSSAVNSMRWHTIGDWSWFSQNVNYATDSWIARDVYCTQEVWISKGNRVAIYNVKHGKNNLGLQ